ncbi:MAG: hypothetical protein V3U20_02505 [Thermoplasmata archaeon]
MKKTGEDKSELLKDCNCLNCRLGRIEVQLNHVQHVLESIAPPANPGKNPGKTSKKTKKKNKKK